MEFSKTKSSSLIIKKSIFTAYISYINSKEELDTFLKMFSDKKASHNCYAYLFNDNGIYGGMSDDNEPKNTAGKPIFNVIQKSGLENVCILVIRNYGGIKLGAGPLTRAYSKVASKVVKELNII